MRTSKPKANSLHGCVNLSVVSNRERCRPALALLAPLEEGAHVGEADKRLVVVRRVVRTHADIGGAG